MFLSASVIASAARAQAAAAGPEALLDSMTGHWVMTGTIARKPVTHDVDVDWVLNREYIRIHEVSREMDAGGSAAYEAWIYVTWDQANREYVVMWLDNTAATNFAPEGIGHAKQEGGRMSFLFKLADRTGIRTTFAHDRATDTWSWAIDNLDASGKASSFAALALTRRK